MSLITVNEIIDSAPFKVKLQTVLTEYWRRDLENTIKLQAEVHVSRIVDDKVKLAIVHRASDIRNQAIDAVREEAKKFITNDSELAALMKVHRIAIEEAVKKLAASSISELDRYYRLHLDKVINEDKYQIVNSGLIASLSDKYAIEFSRIYNQCIISLNHEMAAFKQKQITLDHTLRLYSDLTRDVETLRTDLTFYKWISMIAGCGLTASVLFLMAKCRM